MDGTVKLTDLVPTQRFGHSLRLLILRSTDAHNSEFARLGLTDTVLLEVISAKRPLITVDLELYSAAFSKGEEAAINFTRFQDL